MPKEGKSCAHLVCIGWVMQYWFIDIRCCNQILLTVINWAYVRNQNLFYFSYVSRIYINWITSGSMFLSAIEWPRATNPKWFLLPVLCLHGSHVRADSYLLLNSFLLLILHLNCFLFLSLSICWIHLSPGSGISYGWFILAFSIPISYFPEMIYFSLLFTGRNKYGGCKAYVYSRRYPEAWHSPLPKAWLHARFLGFLSTEVWIHSLYLLRKISELLALEDRVLGEVSQPTFIYLVGSQFIQVVHKTQGQILSSWINRWNLKDGEDWLKDKQACVRNWEKSRFTGDGWARVSEVYVK